MDRFRFDEASTGAIEGDIIDRAGDPVPASQLTAASLTVYDLDTGRGGVPSDGILNGRDDQDVLNDNDVTIDSDGHFVWSLQPEDNHIVTPRRQVERHHAMFRFVWAGGEFLFECEVDVNNLSKAPVGSP